MPIAIASGRKEGLGPLSRAAIQLEARLIRPDAAVTRADAAALVRLTALAYLCHASCLARRAMDTSNPRRRRPGSTAYARTSGGGRDAEQERCSGRGRRRRRVAGARSGDPFDAVITRPAGSPASRAAESTPSPARTEAQHRTADPGRVVARWLVAAVAITYGFAKLNESQFTILDSELDKPLGTVSGFWLTWYYFGYSKVYGTIIACAQILGGLLLTLRATALLGALLLSPVFANIVLVDVFYGIDPGATVIALGITIGLLYVVAPAVPAILEVILPSQRAWLRGSPLLWIPRLALVGGAFVLTYWTANFNNRSPTPIDGVWVPAAEDADFEKVFFERNRAHMVVIKHGEGDYREHQFQVDDEGRVIIRQRYRPTESVDDSGVIMEGRTNPDGSLTIWPIADGPQQATPLLRVR